MLDRGIHIIHDLGRNDPVQIFTAPVRIRRRHSARHRLQNAISTHFDSCIHQRAQNALPDGVDNIAVDKQTLRRATDACAACFGVQHNVQRFDRIGINVDIDVHNALEVSKHRHPRLALNQTDKALAAARNDHIDEIRHFQHFRHRRSVACGNQLNGCLGQACSNQSLH